ncbi:MAG: hypothetical protein IKP45_10365 [Bacteroidales bacterium]|nr:hypothetical protein [Bacteroidales bacterium]
MGNIFSFGKKTEKSNKIAVEIQVENMTLDLEDITGFANNHLKTIAPKIEEVVVMDTRANPDLLDKINKIVVSTVKFSVSDSFSVIYIMDIVKKAVVKVFCLCVTDFSESLKEELSNKNHIIRFV